MTWLTGKTKWWYKNELILFVCFYKIINVWPGILSNIIKSPLYPFFFLYFNFLKFSIIISTPNNFFWHWTVSHVFRFGYFSLVYIFSYIICFISPTSTCIIEFFTFCTDKFYPIFQDSTCFLLVFLHFIWVFRSCKHLFLSL